MAFWGHDPEVLAVLGKVLELIWGMTGGPVPTRGGAEGALAHYQPGPETSVCWSWRDLPGDPAPSGLGKHVTQEGAPVEVRLRPRLLSHA